MSIALDNLLALLLGFGLVLFAAVIALAAVCGWVRDWRERRRP